MSRVILASHAILLLVISSFDFSESATECTPGKARLVNGTSENEGVLEICLADSTWSTVCYSGIPSCKTYIVACRQAGFDNAIRWSNNYTAWRINKPKVGFYSCTGVETSLSSCTVQTQYTIDRNCGNHALTLVCSKFSDQECETQNAVRLFGGSKKSEGQLQICRNKKWRDVCDGRYNSDSQALGHIACRQLGYTGNHLISTSHNRHYYNSSVYPYAYTRIHCNSRNYASISSCSIYSASNCHLTCFKQEVAVSCVPETTNCRQNSIRLVGGRNKLEGWLEICIDGVWGRVSGKIEGRSKDVICSTLGYNDEGAKIISRWQAISFNFKSTMSPIMVKYINCCDRDKIFKTCDIHHVEETDLSFSAYQDIAIACSDGCTNGKTRLKGGDTKHEGTVEMCASGTWKAIGLTSWDDVDANVLCQHLYPGQKYAYAVATNSTEFVASSRDVVYDNVRCNGAETTINSCSKSYITSGYTGPTAAVRCHPVCNCNSAA